MKTYRSNETGLFVGRQLDKVAGETYTEVEVPTNPKEDLLKFLNEISSQSLATPIAEAAPAPSTSTQPQPTEDEQAYVRFRAEVAEGRVDIDEWMLNAPLDVCLRLMGLITDRTRAHFAKGKKNATTD
jgi:hypothetical protein